METAAKAPMVCHELRGHPSDAHSCHGRRSRPCGQNPWPRPNHSDKPSSLWTRGAWLTSPTRRDMCSESLDFLPLPSIFEATSIMKNNPC